MIKLAFNKDAIILGDIINAYHNNPLIFNDIKEMFDYIEKETGFITSCIEISMSGGADERFKCEKDPVGFLAWRNLMYNGMNIGVCDLGEKTEK